MANMTPREFLRMTTEYSRNLARATQLHVAVGLPTGTASASVYGNGMSVLQIGAIHEYGGRNMPRRSFLRSSFDTKRDDINEEIATQFNDVLRRGKTAEAALGLVGVTAVNIVTGAFTTRGYGTWPAIQQDTIKRKGSSQTLIDTGTLRNSITYVVRK